MSGPPRSQDGTLLAMEKRLNQLLVALIGITITGIFSLVGSAIYVGGIIRQVDQNKHDIERYSPAISSFNQLVDSLHELKQSQERTNALMLDIAKQSAVNSAFIKQYIREAK